MMWKQYLIGRAEIECDDLQTFDLLVFNHGVNLLGGSRKTYAGVLMTRWFGMFSIIASRFIHIYLQYMISCTHVNFILDGSIFLGRVF